LAVSDDEFRLAAFKEFLLAGGVNSPELDKALVSAATRGRPGHPICGFLVDNGASPERLGGAAVVAASKSFHVDTLEILDPFTTSAAPFAAALDAGTQDVRWLTPEGLETTQYLLEHGASDRDVNSAFCKAARLHERDGVELLISYIAPDALEGVASLVLVRLARSRQQQPPACQVSV